MTLSTMLIISGLTALAIIVYVFVIADTSTVRLIPL